MDPTLSRRDVVTKGLPAAAFLGAGLTGLQAMAQDRPPMRDRAMPGDDKKNESVVAQLMAQAYAGGEYALPKLPYGYDALEPHIDEQTMRIHHDLHHQGYVDGLNKTLASLKEYRQSGEDNAALLYGLERNLSFNGGGHLLHTIFWGTMCPPAQGGGGEPKGDIAKAIAKDFGSFDAFKKYFSSAAGGVKGSGWGVLAYQPLGDQCVVLSMNEHDMKAMVGAVPLLPVDVWEHAYYLKYQNKRSAYIEAWFNVVNWGEVDRGLKYVRAMYHMDHQG